MLGLNTLLPYRHHSGDTFWVMKIVSHLSILLCHSLSYRGWRFKTLTGTRPQWEWYPFYQDDIRHVCPQTTHLYHMKVVQKALQEACLGCIDAFAACFEVPALKFLKYPWQCFQNGIWHEWHAMAVILKIVLCKTKIPTSLFDTCWQDRHMWHECLRLTHVCFFDSIKPRFSCMTNR